VSPGTPNHSTLPLLAVTLGDVRGIGPEVVVKALANPAVQASARFLVIGPTGAGLQVDESIGEWRPGSSAETAGRFAGLAIERAVALALGGTVQGIVTAPLDKAALHAGGYDYPGHTEMLAALTRRPTTMMLAATSAIRHPQSAAVGQSAVRSPQSAALRVVLATTHIPLRDVPSSIDEATIVRAAEAAREGLREWFGIANPRLALCALNPHAGDSGRFGREDDDILAPAARRAGIDGPFPADTVFVRAMRGAYDAVIAPYHDVGMTAIKVASFGHAVNVTLGLPFPRCSPDHGTALDIAGQNKADPSSMIEAMLLCARIASRATTHATR
jgi:4-hydroxythreonine-4-phosphate dehydrogenase